MRNNNQFSLEVEWHHRDVSFVDPIPHSHKFPPSPQIVSCINRKPCYALGGGGSKADQPFTPGQGVGEGLKGELWKAKRPNVSILEIEEGSPVLGLLSLVRNVETVGSEFVCASNRLLRQLLEVAVMELPNDEEAIFNTPAG
ncbi:unnamed protein product, partial [Choristocarpus tenellus]